MGWGEGEGEGEVTYLREMKGQVNLRSSSTLISSISR